MEIPSCCPHCDAALRWELDLTVDRELGWQHPHAPSFGFRCLACDGELEITFEWRLQRGSDPRRLLLVGGATAQPPLPRILLVDSCPHGCGTRLGLQLDPGHPWARGVAWPDEDRVLGGYRCPTCDGEGLLLIRPLVTAGA